METTIKKPINRTELIEYLIKLVEQIEGKSFNQVLKQINPKNEYGALYGRKDYKDKGFYILYTGNPNFAGGVRNGYGPGWYFGVNQFVGCGATQLKIRSTL